MQIIAREQQSDGALVRPPSTFREWVRADGSGDLPAAHGRYHLYVAKACPWASLALSVRRLKRLEHTISVSFAHPLHDERGWAFPGKPFCDDVNDFEVLADAYERSDPGYDAQHTLPVLWDKHEGRIVNNDSADIVRMLNSEFDEWGDGSLDLFVTLGALDLRLGERRYLTGDRITEADWRLFVTLVRFDAVYYPLFKCDLRRITDYEHLWGYTRELHQWPGVAENVDLGQIKAHYYAGHPRLNPTRIIPDGPALDFEGPMAEHGSAPWAHKADR